TGTPTALLDGEAITAARTAACSALATDLLARRDAKRLVVIGSGVQARAHLRAVSRVRAFDHIAIAARDARKAEALSRDIAAIVGQGPHVARSIEDGVRESDVICACTHSAEPV